MTIYEKYYAMNKALNEFLIGNGYPCPVYKYGTVPEGITYPYIQTTYRITKRQAYGSSQRPPGSGMNGPPRSWRSPGCH